MKLTLLYNHNVVRMTTERPYLICLFFGVIWMLPIVRCKKKSYPNRSFLISDGDS